MVNKESNMYLCWLSHREVKKSKYSNYLKNIVVKSNTSLIKSAINEFEVALKQCDFEESKSNIFEYEIKEDHIVLRLIEDSRIVKDGYIIKHELKEGKASNITISAINEEGILYGSFALLRLLEQGTDLDNKEIIDNPSKSIRMIDHWDNLDGTVERGFSGSSILYESVRNKDKMKDIMAAIGINATYDLIRDAFNDDYKVASDLDRINDYARMLCSIGINAITINNTNVHTLETELINKRIDVVKTISDIMIKYGIITYLSINFASPITLKDLDTSDPLYENVIKWWREKIKYVYSVLPNLGGFMVKADSEGRPGPFTYGRNHADGANMLAKELQPYGGKLIWRCFVYNCRQDWRDKRTDRAKAAFECFAQLDGEFLDNVYLQIKNGPMDFQVREPISPLFGKLDKTNMLMEFQITQEYTGQQKHVCYLIPWWKEILESETYANNEYSSVADRIEGIAGVVNVGNDENWTGSILAQANLYGYGRIIWNSEISSEQIAQEWIKLTLGDDELVVKNIEYILMNSWKAYENYTSPLGIGWMVAPGHHYGPDVNGYEFSSWGTYHRADCKGIGIDRTMETGTGYVNQYNEPLSSRYNNLYSCPDELLLFFHHVSYNHILKSNKTVIEHIYDSHFEGYETVEKFIDAIKEIKERLNREIYESILNGLYVQLESAKEWRDIINTYFYRISGISDKKNRKIY